MPVNVCCCKRFEPNKIKSPWRKEIVIRAGVFLNSYLIIVAAML